MNSLKAAVAGLTTIQNFIQGGMPIEDVTKFVKSSGQHITPSAFKSLQEARFVTRDERGKVVSYGDAKYPELVALVEKLDLVGKAKSSRASTGTSGNGKGSTNFALIQAQYPTEAAVIQAMLDIPTKSYKVTLEDGSVGEIAIQVAFKRVDANAPKRSDKTEASQPVV